MIVVSHDVPGVQSAARELFEESLYESETKRTLALLKPEIDDVKSLEKCVRARKLSSGYYLWVEYLIWLRGMMEVGAQFALLADEAQGLRVLAAARSEFEAEHPGCFKCGIRQWNKAAPRCRSCGQNFRKD